MMSFAHTPSTIMKRVDVKPAASMASRSWASCALSVAEAASAHVATLSSMARTATSSDGLDTGLGEQLAEARAELERLSRRDAGQSPLGAVLRHVLSSPQYGELLVHMLFVPPHMQGNWESES